MPKSKHRASLQAHATLWRFLCSFTRWVPWIILGFLLVDTANRVANGDLPGPIRILGSTLTTFVPFGSATQANITQVSEVAWGKGGTNASYRKESSSIAQLFCEDSSPRDCAQLLSMYNNVSHGLQAACHPHAAGTLAFKCPRSCGVCAIILSDCHSLEVVADPGACMEKQDVVGEVCANDGNLKKEGYCTWLGGAEGALHFACARCSENEAMSPERRAMTAQMAELRLEEDGREADKMLRGSNEALEDQRESYVKMTELEVRR